MLLDKFDAESEVHRFSAFTYQNALFVEACNYMNTVRPKYHLVKKLKHKKWHTVCLENYNHWHQTILSRTLGQLLLSRLRNCEKKKKIWIALHVHFKLGYFDNKQRWLYVKQYRYNFVHFLNGIRYLFYQKIICTFCFI